MKLWYSFTKELKLSSKSFYFYIELGMAIIFLVILLFVIPENFSNTTTEYIYMDLPDNVLNEMKAKVLEDDLDGKSEIIELGMNDEIIKSEYYETDDTKMYLLNSEEELIFFSKKEKKLGAVMTIKDNEIHYKYYLQGYESEKLRNIYLVFHNADMNALMEKFDDQVVKSLSTGYVELSDRENVVPAFLTFNGSLMGLFIVAAYIFLDKKEGIVTAYAVTASSLWHYLASKIGVILVTSIVTSLILVVPIMGFQPNYVMMIIFLLTSGFFSSALGLLIASYYDNIMQAFGVIYIVVIVLLLPNIAYFIPSWEPVWMKYIPTYVFLNAFKEIIIVDGDTNYILMSSLIFLILGIILFVFSQYRYKKTLRVSG